MGKTLDRRNAMETLGPMTHTLNPGPSAVMTAIPKVAASTPSPPRGEVGRGGASAFVGSTDSRGTAPLPRLSPGGRGMVVRLLLLMAIPVMTTPTPADAQFAGRQQCLAKAEAAPDFALAEIVLWEKRGGGDDAALCRAFALLFQGSWAEAGAAFETVIPRLQGEAPDVRANLWARAGLAWDAADDPARAEAAYGQAIALAPEDVSYRLDRATVLAAQERYWDAMADLDAAVAADPKSVDARILRAETRRGLAQDTEALADVQAALAIDPAHPDALLLQGNLLARWGDVAGARAAWTKARQSGGDAAAGRAAAANLEALEKFEVESAVTRSPAAPRQ